MPKTANDRLSPDEIGVQLAGMNAWTFDAEKAQIEKTFVRKSFVEASEFIGQIAQIAERHDHHPDILLHGYKNVKVMLSTHSAGGITQNDFDVARDIDSL
jgi:4a-hydroxytetrahydrobiopterin dehydratase